MGPTERALDIGNWVEAFVREIVFPDERDQRCDHHGAPLDELVFELRDKARSAGVLTPHILPDGDHLSQLETAYVLQKSGLSPLGPLAVNTMAPDEGNMYLLGRHRRATAGAILGRLADLTNAFAAGYHRQDLNSPRVV